jgi:hypothetical protein
MIITHGKVTCETKLESLRTFAFLMQLVKPVEIVCLHEESRKDLVKLCKREVYQPLITYVTKGT